ncbi:MAG TPA: ubiquinol-cytochrome c reductase iron-sulfur subunit [Terriglobia bacterium]
MENDTGREDDSLPRAEEDLRLPGRRSFLGLVIGAGSAVVGVLMAIPLLRFALYPLFAQTTAAEWSDVGPVDSFGSLSAPVQKLITVPQRDGWREVVSQRPVYVTKDQAGQVEVLSATCPHLGCEVPWSPEKHAFYCPCHGSVFASDGSRISGPAPRGLDSLASTVENGRLKVRFQYFRQLLPEKEAVS